MKIKRIGSLSDTFDLELRDKAPFDVVGFGLNSVDHLCLVPKYPQVGAKTEIAEYKMLPGGQVATALIFLSRMGLKTKYIGKVGGDDFGRYSLESIRSEAVDTTSILIERNAQSQFSIIVIDQRIGERTVLCHRDNRLDFRNSEMAEKDICSGKILHLDGYDPAAQIAADWCQSKGIPVCMDLDKVVPDCRHLIKKIDFLIVSSNFPPEFTGISDPIQAFFALQECFVGFLVMTMGSAGALAIVGNKCIQCPGLKVDAVDTTGAGDIFHGAFIYGLLQNWPLGRILNFANTAAGLSCLRLGARTGIRELSEILQNMARLPG
jgi:sulfofructose kinase